jgi:glycosyltransferase involved in cell wall biosynthesis
VSRLTSEKGVRELVQAWPPGERLDIIGAGPEEQGIRALSREGVTLVGTRPRDEVLASMPAYRGLVFPSRCIEMQPTVLVEALACGLPIVAFDGSAGAALVDRTQAGAIYDTPLALRAALSQVSSEREVMRDRADAAYRQIGTMSQWQGRITDLYATVIAGRSA